MDDDDIVPRLRLWAEGVQNQKAVVLAVAITEAADEIERLRNERNAFEAERDELVRISNKLKHERDEARREVCSMNETGLRMNESDKKREAKRRGWDCFKEEAKDA